MRKVAIKHDARSSIRVGWHLLAPLARLAILLSIPVATLMLQGQGLPAAPEKGRELRTSAGQDLSPADATARSRSGTVVYNNPSNNRDPWYAILAPLAGVVVGGMITLAGIWLKDRRDRVAAVREWVGDEFVFGGTQPVYVVMEKLKQLLLQREASVIASPTVDFPMTELSKLRLLLNTAAVTEFISLVGRFTRRGATQNTERAKEIVGLIEAQQMNLTALERWLFESDVKEKRAVYTAYNSPELKEIVAVIVSTTEKLAQLGL